MNSFAGRVAVKYRDVFHTTQTGAKIVPALRVVTEKAPLMSTDGQAAIAIPATTAFGHPCPSYAGAPGRRALVCVAYMDVGQGREQDAEALLVAYLEQLKGAPRALIDAFSAHNRGGDERSTSPNVF